MALFPTLFAVLNVGKRSAAVDLKNEAGKNVVLNGWRRLTSWSRDSGPVWCAVSGWTTRACGV